jgi:hypothetical protein
MRQCSPKKLLLLLLLPELEAGTVICWQEVCTAGMREAATLPSLSPAAAVCGTSMQSQLSDATANNGLQLPAYTVAPPLCDGETRASAAAVCGPAHLLLLLLRRCCTSDTQHAGHNTCVCSDSMHSAAAAPDTAASVSDAHGHGAVLPAAAGKVIVEPAALCCS